MPSQKLNPEQERAVIAPSRPLLVVAGAGTGKTRTLTSRIIHMIEGGVPPETICAVTFTNKAAKEMEERIATGVALKKGARPFIGTFHALGAMILRREAPLAGRTRGFTIFDGHDAFQVVKKMLRETVGYKEKGNKDMAPAIVSDAISKIKNGVSGPREKNAQKFFPLFERYEEKMEAQNAFDFDDLIVKVVRIFEKHPKVLRKYQNKFTHILVDEYQDVSPMQYRLVKLLAGASGNVTAVGDDHQMIYSWRYASLEIFLDFERDWPGAQVMLLEENYRSTKTIIEAAAALIAHNKRQREKRLWTQNKEGNPIILRESGDEEDEAEWIAEEILKINHQKSKIAAGESESVAILYRINAQSRALEQALLRRNIPYRIVGGTKFYERREVKDILAALRYAANPKDEVSMDRLDDALTKRGGAEARSLLDTAETKSPAELIGLFLGSTEYLERLERAVKNPRERRENIRELARFAERFENLEAFLEEAALVQANDMPKNAIAHESDAPPVHLSTIHLAKGLEFDRVFIAGAAEGILPHSLSLDSEDEIEEERRLMYVAMTRAKKDLAISFYHIPSRFLGELPQERLALEGRSGKKLSLDDLDDEERYIEID